MCVIYMALIIKLYCPVWCPLPPWWRTILGDQPGEGFRTGWVRPFLNLNLALLRGAALVATNTCLFWFWPRGGRTLREPWCVDRAGHLLVPWIIPSRGRLNRDSVGHRQANRQNHSFATIHLHSFMKFFLIILKARKCYVMLCSYSKNESR